MKHMLCIVDGREDYTPISEQAWEKIAQAIRNKAIPPSFKLKGKTIVSDTILGLTDKPLPQAQPSIKDFKQFRARILNSEWYQRSKVSRQSESYLLL